jgi:hypothetical protein
MKERGVIGRNGRRDVEDWDISGGFGWAFDSLRN